MLSYMIPSAPVPPTSFYGNSFSGQKMFLFVTFLLTGYVFVGVMNRRWNPLQSRAGKYDVRCPSLLLLLLLLLRNTKRRVLEEEEEEEEEELNWLENSILNCRSPLPETSSCPFLSHVTIVGNHDAVLCRGRLLLCSPNSDAALAFRQRS